MKPDQLTDALEAAAVQVGIRVRYEAMTGETAGSGGLCRIRDEWRVIIDRRSTASERVAVLAEALGSFDTESIYLAPEVREAIDRHRRPTVGGAT